jgi:VWFA-related protein
MRYFLRTLFTRIAKAQSRKGSQRKKLFSRFLTLRLRVSAVGLLFLLILGLTTVSGDETRFQGKTLEAALKQLQLEGLNILFSSDLVRSDMIVMNEPNGLSDLRTLAELLYPHGLRIQPGPENTLLVVRAKPLSKSTSLEPEQSERSETVVVPFVNVYFTALDPRNRPVTHLEAKHFVLQEDGKMQSLVELASGYREPITVFFLLDSSSSMKQLQDGARKYDVSKQAMLRVIDALRPEDQMMVVGFNERFWTINGMTKDRDLVRGTVAPEKPGVGRTALYDALIGTLKLTQGYSGRKLVVVCSDGEDNYSKSNLEEVIALLKVSDVTVMAFGTTTNGDVEKKGFKSLRSITEISGGFSFFSSKLAELDSAIKDFRNILDNQYVAGYVPPEPMIHKRREVRIFCLVPGINLHYRKSYLF